MRNRWFAWELGGKTSSSFAILRKKQRGTYENETDDLYDLRAGWKYRGVFFWRMDFRNDNASYLYVHRLCYGLMVAGIFKKSKKTESGALESHAGWKGLCRKGVTLLIVLVACRLDMTIGLHL